MGIQLPVLQVCINESCNTGNFLLVSLRHALVSFFIDIINPLTLLFNMQHCTINLYENKNFLILKNLVSGNLKRQLF